MSADIKRSVSLYSYQDEYYDGKLDLEGCLRETSKAGAAGVELLAEEMIKQFPNPILTEEFRQKWNGWLEKYSLTPTCYDAFLENRIYDNRTLSLGEQVEMMCRDLKLASLLGFTSLRTLVSTPLDVIEGSLAYAEKVGVRIGLEVHAPFSLNSTWAEGYMDLIRRSGSKYFGFIPDMGIFCKKVPDVVADKWRRQGAREDCIKLVNDAYEERVSKGFVKIEYDLDLGRANMNYRNANGLSDLTQKLEAMGAGPADLGYLNASYTYSWSDPQDLIDNIENIVHVHAKTYHTTKEYVETAVAIPEVVSALKKAGYQGYLSTEYEGGESLRDAFDVDGIEQVRRHQEAMRRAIEG
ncbi:MAG TPA: AP endonuclease [Lachnospiraceae bacterium]|nr:AP endonuclease [Lachnospiraceae bacterium]